MKLNGDHHQFMCTLLNNYCFKENVMNKRKKKYTELRVMKNIPLWHKLQLKEQINLFGHEKKNNSPIFSILLRNDNCNLLFTRFKTGHS